MTRSTLNLTVLDRGLHIFRCISDRSLTCCHSWSTDMPVSCTGHSLAGGYMASHNANRCTHCTMRCPSSRIGCLRVMDAEREREIYIYVCVCVRPNCAKRVSETYLHWPKITVSPSATLKQGDTCTGTFVCLFSYLQLTTCGHQDACRD